MKTQSLKELQEAVRILDYARTDLSNAKEDIESAIDRIKAAIFMETPLPKGSFDLWDFVSDDECRPAMCGVFHDGGYKVASDATVMAAVRESYDEALEHHIVGKDGRYIIGKYPKWNTVIPRNDEESTAHTIDTAKVYELVKRMKAENKLVGKHERIRAFARIGDTFFDAEKLVLACRFMDHYGVTEIRTWAWNRAARIDAPDGSVLIIMPIMKPSVLVDKYGYRSMSEADLSKTWDDPDYKYIRLVAA